MERIPAESWRDYAGHVERYRWAASGTGAGEHVNDIACGVGYGASLVTCASYHGYDKPGVPRGDLFGGEFTGCDLDDPSFVPRGCDVTLCFETLEHVQDPARLAEVICESTRRAVFVSVPVIPTVENNPWHRHDFTAAGIPPLFAGFTVAQDWYQEAETSHVWMLTRG